MTKFFVDTPIRSSPWFSEKVEVRESSLHGLGVFATELIKKNEIFESAPVIQFDQFTMVHLFDLHGYRHILHDYVFSFNGKAAIALGMGSIYNHSNDNANAYAHAHVCERGRLARASLRCLPPAPLRDT